MKSFKQLFNEIITLVEERPFGHSPKHIDSWLRANGYEPIDQTGSHPKYRHKETGELVPGVNSHHKTDVATNAVKNSISIVRAHHTKYNFRYIPVDDRSLK